MTSNNRPIERKSLWEESMLVLANILRLSSLSLARKSLAVTTAVDDQHPLSSSSSSHKKQTAMINKSSSGNLAQMPERNRSKRSQMPERRPNLSYVVLPADDHEVEASASSYVVHEGNMNNSSDGRFSDYIRRFHQKTENDLQNAVVEGKAADYIKKFHEKNRNDVNNDSRRFSTYYVMPPPPPQLGLNNKSVP
ncbi:hypothetical protein Ancab_020596 [Ancistrocladus abbreviatus]